MIRNPRRNKVAPTCVKKKSKLVHRVATEMASQKSNGNGKMTKRRSGAVREGEACTYLSVVSQ
jgi:hypothetical protein